MEKAFVSPSLFGKFRPQYFSESVWLRILNRVVSSQLFANLPGGWSYHYDEWSVRQPSCLLINARSIDWSHFFNVAAESYLARQRKSLLEADPSNDRYQGCWLLWLLLKSLEPGESSNWVGQATGINRNQRLTEEARRYRYRKVGIHFPFVCASLGGQSSNWVICTRLVSILPNM